ncbi:MAG: glycosyltransferase family 39 protein [Elainellaceae cyanobacterium]
MSLVVEPLFFIKTIIVMNAKCLPKQATTRLRESWSWLPITLILLVAATLYIYNLDGESCWIDELLSIDDAKSGKGLPPRNLIRPLYYMLLSAWMVVDSSDFWLRGLSVLFGLGSIFLVYRLACRTCGRTEGVIAASLMTFSPLFVNHTQEIRMYVMSACLGLAGTLAFIRAIERPSLANCGWWASLRFLAMLTFPLNVTLLLPDALFVLVTFRHHRKLLLQFGACFALIGLFWIPSILSVMSALSPSSAYVKHHSEKDAPGLAHIFRMLKFLTVWPFRVQTNPILANFYKGFTALLAALAGIALLRKRHTNRLLWIAAWAILPSAQVFVFSQVSTSLWVQRYLLFVCPYVFILLAAGLTRIWHQWRVAAIAIIGCYVVAVTGGLVHYYSVQERTDYREAIEVIETNEQPGDAIAWSIHHGRPRVPLNHYYQGSATIQIKSRLPGKDLKASDVDIWLSDLSPIESRLWIVYSKLSEEELDLFEAGIESKFDIQSHQKFYGGLEVFLVTS